MSKLFDEIFRFRNLWTAYEKSLKNGGKYKSETLKFSRNLTVNLKDLQKSLYDRTYKFSGYTQFNVYEPKERVINAPYYKDKIVQLAMHDVLSDMFIPKFINHSYACMKDRGTHRAVDQVQKNLKSAKWKWGEEAYVCRVDVHKFFYSIDRDILKEQYRRAIKEEDVLWIIDEIVDSGGLIDEVGLPLGNTLSQLCANIALNDLDQYCKRYLGYKYYVRYADDVVIVLPNKKATQIAKKECENFLKNRLNMQANRDKTQIFPLAQGCDAFGFKIFTTHRLLRDDSKRDIKRKVKKMPDSISAGRMTVEKANEMLASWSGHAKHANSYNFMMSIVKRRPYIKYVNENNMLKINEEELNDVISKRKQIRTDAVSGNV